MKYREASYPEVLTALEGPHGDNATLYARTAALQRAANFPTPEKFAEDTLLRFVEKCKQLGIAILHENILRQMLATVGSLYVMEYLISLPPNPAHYGYHNDSEPLGIMRDMLLHQQQKAINPQATLNALSNAFVAGFVVIARHLPEIAQHNGEDAGGEMTIPLIDVLSDVGAIIEKALEPFSYVEARDIGLFRWFNRHLAEKAQKLSEALRSKLMIPPSDYDGSPAEIVDAYLKDSFFDNIFTAQVPFVLPRETRFSGHWIIAPPGRGKTVCLTHLVLDDIDSDDDPCVIVMDSKGDLIGPLSKLKGLEDRLLLIEPDAEHPIALNPLDLPKSTLTQTVDNLEYIFSSLLEAKMTALQQTLFRSVLRALTLTFPNPTLATFRDIVANGIGPYKQYIDLLPQDLQDFFYREFPTDMYKGTREQVKWRLRLLLENEIISKIFTAPKTRIDMGQEMDTPGRIILINNSLDRLGEAGVEFFSRYFIAQVHSAATARSGRKPEDKLPVYFYIDECGDVIKRDPKFIKILDTCRSQKVAIIAAHQRTAQVDDSVLSALSNCAIRFTNSDDEARYLADKFRTTPEFLRSLPKGAFAAFVRDMTPHALALKIPYYDLTKFPQQSAAEQQALRERMRHQFSFTPQSEQVAPPPAASPAPAPLPVMTTAPLPTAVDPDIGAHAEPATKWGD